MVLESGFRPAQCTFLLQLIQKASPLAWQDPMPTACHRGPLWRWNMLGPKEPNLYKDLSQGTVTKGIQIKIFSKKNFFLNFYFSLCHYYENLTNLTLNKSEGPYTTKLVKLYITYFVMFKLLKLLKLFSLSGSFLFLKVEVTPNKSSSWILISCFVKLAQSEHSLQNIHNKHGQHG